MPPEQFSHAMCGVTTERHPMHAFVRHVMGAAD